MMLFINFVDRVLIPSLLTFLLIGGVSGVALGCALLVRSERTLKFVRSMNRWVSSRRAMREMEIPRQAHRPLTSGKPWLGAFLVIGGAFVLYYLIARVEIPRTAAVLGVDLQRWFLAGVALQTSRWFLVAGSALAVAVGLLLLFFPRALRAFEVHMNHWYSTRQLLAESDAMRTPLDFLVEAYPRPCGWIIAASSALVAAAMTVLLVARFAR